MKRRKANTHMRPQRYNVLMKVIHTVMAVLIIFMLISGLRFSGMEAADRFELIKLHKSIGVLILILLFFRVIGKASFKKPADLGNSFIKNRVTHLVHSVLYILMFMIPVSGYLMSNTKGYAVSFFGKDLPTIIGVNPTLNNIFSNMHDTLPYILMGVLLLHIGAFIINLKLCDAKTVVRRMW